MSESNAKDWRELCAAASRELDSERLFSLVNEILEAFDQHDAKSVQMKRPLTGLTES